MNFVQKIIAIAALSALSATLVFTPWKVIDDKMVVRMEFRSVVNPPVTAHASEIALSSVLLTWTVIILAWVAMSRVFRGSNPAGRPNALDAHTDFRHYRRHETPPENQIGAQPRRPGTGREGR